MVYYNHLLSSSDLLSCLEAVFAVTHEFLSCFYYVAKLNVNFFNKSEHTKIYSIGKDWLFWLLDYVGHLTLA